jgi:molybdopterin synthase catalytic subunit
MQASIILTPKPILRPPLISESREVGAVLEFDGIVREKENGLPIKGLHYEAYEPMAEKVMRAIFEEIAVEHPCESVEFIHRLGWVPVGESSLYIRVQSKHRAPTFGFLQECIDRMKRDAPIWKIN